MWMSRKDLAELGFEPRSRVMDVLQRTYKALTPNQTNKLNIKLQSQWISN